MSCGVDRGAIQYRVGIGRLHPVFPCVFAVGTPPDTREGWFMAASLSVPDSSISHFSAGQNFEVFRGKVGRIYVTVPRRLRDRGRIRIHSVKNGVPTTVHNGIPTTTIEQTLLDLATVMYSERAYTRAVREALIQELTTYEALCDFAQRRAPGAPRMRAVLAKGNVRTRSRPEDDVFALLARHDFPTPQQNVELHRQEVDLYWPDHGLVVEVDGGVHDNELARAEDRRKQAILEATGLRVIRIEDDQIGNERQTVDRVDAALRALGWEG
jgi:very-short-patch-repair endonuclease